jgi:hypothetical protein
MLLMLRFTHFADNHHDTITVNQSIPPRQRGGIAIALLLASVPKSSSLLTNRERWKTP